MRRAHRLAIAAAAGAVGWQLALQLPLSRPAWLGVLAAPLVLLALLGLYMVALLAHGVLSFRSCPEEAEALQQDIARARRELEARGFDFGAAARAAAAGAAAGATAGGGGGGGGASPGFGDGSS